MSKHWILIAVIAAFVAGCGSGYVKRTEQFATRVKGVVNPDELQAWATNLIARTTIVDPKTPVEVSEADVPGFIRAIYNENPEEVDVFGETKGAGNADAYVQITYGSGFGHWGLYVGFPTLQEKSDANFYVVQWKPGIYFWDGP